VSEAEVEIRAGVCGFVTLVRAEAEDGLVAVDIMSDCPGFSQLNGRLGQFDAYTELFRPLAEGALFRLVSSHQRHVTCPVLIGLLKAIEAAAGLALPKDASIRFLTSQSE